MADISQYLVNHLVTFSLQSGEVRSVEEALSRLSHLGRTDRLWSQEMLVEVSSEAVRLRDAQNQDELEAFHMSSIHRCDAIHTNEQFPNLLLLVCQNVPQKKPDILFFSCETVGVELIQDDITLAVTDYTSKTNHRVEVLRASQVQKQQQPVRMMALPGIPDPPLPHAPNPPPPNPPPYPGRANGSGNQRQDTSLQRAEREVAILNHCFDDIELFMGKLQKSAEALSILSQRNKKKKSRKKDAEEDLLTLRARPPAEDEFVDIFQKFKYCFSLLARLKLCISNPTSEELLHHVFIPLDMIVRTTGGPAMAASVSTPAMTSGAVSLLQDNLSVEERQLWTALGTNWTLPRSQLRGPVPPYTPVFMDGWKPEPLDPHGQPWEDPIESQHKHEALREKQEMALSQPGSIRSTDYTSDERDGAGLPPEGDRQYRCSYDFVARNSSELSVLQGETLEVIESSKRWWKCRNRFNQIGFVPFNILEPLSALNDTPTDSPASPKETKPSPSYSTRATYTPPTPPPLNHDPPILRPPSMSLHTQHSPSTEETDKVMVINEELLQRLANGKASITRPLVIPRSSDTSAPLDYHSPPSEVEEWLRGKGFSEPTVRCLGVLTGAQLFSLNKEELRAVTPDEGARVYSQIMVQKALLEDARKATELEAVMEKQKMKVDLKLESSLL